MGRDERKRSGSDHLEDRIVENPYTVSQRGDAEGAKEPMPSVSKEFVIA